MAERPILFSAPMVRAILAGTKTQTRRALAPDLFISSGGAVVRMVSAGPATTGIQPAHCPYWRQHGDTLWVRESFSGARAYELHGYPLKEWGNKLWYWADGNPPRGDWTKPRPSIHMPRGLSRITLEITEVRVERLQDISEADALAEGIDMKEPVTMPIAPNVPSVTVTLKPRTAVEAYATLWESINGPGSWAANPWVWVLTFKRLLA